MWQAVAACFIARVVQAEALKAKLERVPIVCGRERSSECCLPPRNLCELLALHPLSSRECLRISLPGLRYDDITILFFTATYGARLIPATYGRLI